MKHVSPEFLRAEAEALRAALGDSFDSETFFDTLDGETDILDIIDALLEEIAQAKAFEAANKELASTYSSKAAMFAARQEKMRGTLLRFMEATGEKKIQRPGGTVSLKAVAPGLILAPDFEPSPAYANVKVTPDKKAILGALKGGEIIPGASMGNGGMTVQIR